MSHLATLSRRLLPFAGPIAVVAVAALGLALPFAVASKVGSNDRNWVSVLPALDLKQVVHGREVYSTTCVACHAADAKGVPNLGKDLTAGFAREKGDGDLITMVMRGRQPGEPGHTSAAPMPPKGGRAELSRADIADVVAYLRGLQSPSRLPAPLPEPVEVADATPAPTTPAPAEVDAGKPAATGNPVVDAARSSVATVSSAFDAESATRGKKVFNSCIACHGKTGAGVANLGADLIHSEFVTNKSDEELIAFIKKGRLPTDPDTRLKLNMPPKGGNPALNDKQLADVVAYLRSLQATQSASR